MSNNVWDRIEESRNRLNVLEHPFYIRWSNGELSEAELANYAGQYRHATEAIAKLSADAAAVAPSDEVRDELRRHAEEEQGHIEMWDGFVEETGGEIGAEPTAETTECVRSWTATEGYLPALARLYAIESGQPEIAKVKRDGLTRFYGVNEGPGTRYFSVHEKLDEHHAAEARRLIESAISSETDEDLVVKAAESAFAANLRLLDGVS